MSGFKVGDEIRITATATEEHDYDIVKGVIESHDGSSEGGQPWRVEGVDAHGNEDYDYVNAVDMVHANKFPEGVNKVMSGIVNKVKDLTLSADDKLLRNQGVTDAQGNVTEEGQEILLAVLFEANKAEIVARVKKVVAEEKAEKK
jgi:hypothetical protein